MLTSLNYFFNIITAVDIDRCVDTIKQKKLT